MLYGRCKCCDWSPTAPSLYGSSVQVKKKPSKRRLYKMQDSDDLMCSHCIGIVYEVESEDELDELE